MTWAWLLFYFNSATLFAYGMLAHECKASEQRQSARGRMRELIFWMAVHVCMSELLAMCVKREKFILYEPKFFRYYALSPSFKNQEEKKFCLCMCIFSFCPGMFQHFYPIFVFSLCLTFLRTHHPFRTNHESHWKCPSYLLRSAQDSEGWR